MSLNLDFLKKDQDLNKRDHHSIETSLDDYFKTLLLEREPKKPIGGVMYIETDHTRANGFFYELRTVVFDTPIEVKDGTEVISFEEFAKAWSKELSNIDGEDVSVEVVEAFCARIVELYGLPTAVNLPELGGATLIFEHFVVCLEREEGKVEDAEISEE